MIDGKCDKLTSMLYMCGDKGFIFREFHRPRTIHFSLHRSSRENDDFKL